MRPFTNGDLTPNYAAHGSPVHPVGTGAGSGFFTITDGQAEVDSVRLQMWDANQTTLFVELFLPVRYIYSPHEISNIVFTPDSPEGFVYNENVSVTFDYRTIEPGGVRIWMRPFTDGALTPNYAAHASPLYPAGNGAGSGFFTIVSGEATVDSARFEMADGAGTTTLLEFFVPVNYHYAEHKVNNLEFLPPSPAYFSNGHYDSLRFDYTTIEAGGALVFPRPFTQGELSPDYAASPSPIYPVGSGSGVGWFTITSGDVHVDHVRVLATNSGQTANLLEWFLPVSYFFGSQTVVGVDEIKAEAPLVFGLHQNFPNPFNPGTTIVYEVPRLSHVIVKVYNSIGQEVVTLVDGPAQPGRHSVQFDGSSLPSGVYFARLLAEGYSETRGLVLLK
jgi:hypothetical protein